MAKCSKLLAKAQNNAAGLRFSEICKLAECPGFYEDGGRGSHVIYKREGLGRPLNFQNYKGNAIAYQVKQLLQAMEELGLSGEGRNV